MRIGSIFNWRAGSEGKKDNPRDSDSAGVDFVDSPSPDENVFPEEPATSWNDYSEESAGYADSWELLADEFDYLDLLLRRRLRDRDADSDNILDQFKGLVISRQEVAALLSRSIAQPESSSDLAPEALHRAAASLDSLIETRRQASRNQESRLSLDFLSRLFRLTRFEERCLIISLAPEIDSKYEKLYAYLHDDVTRKKPSVGLMLDLLCQSTDERLAARSVFFPNAPLMRFKLLHFADPSSDSPQPLLARTLKLDDRIAEFLIGFQRRLDPKLSSFARMRTVEEEERAAPPAQLKDPLIEFVRVRSESGERLNWIFKLRGRLGAGKRALAACAARELGWPLISVDTARLLHSGTPPADAFWRLGRDCLLSPAVLCLENFDVLTEADRGEDLKALIEALEMFGPLAFLVGEKAWRPSEGLRNVHFVSLKIAFADDDQRALQWQEESRALSWSEDVNPGALGGQFRFTPGAMSQALSEARDRALWESPRQGTVDPKHLYAACRAQSRPRLTGLAAKIEPAFSWNDIVLPGDSLSQLREICDQARCRHIVLGRWGFGRKLSLGKGLSALFSGPPGTGKTMAAEVVAGELGLELYKIDLSQVVSKYIGETEKNLDRIFSAAEHSSAILFFDEADALFGKRSEVRDSHDRYANVEISFLLQKMEEYEGVSILATNLRRNMDDAFVRRLQTIIEFPFPDAQYRERIWRVTFPPTTPLDEDVDFAVLAGQIRMAGGHIKNIGLAAAYLAAADGGVVRMEHLMSAARREHQKLGRSWNDAAQGRRSRVGGVKPS